MNIIYNTFKVTDGCAACGGRKVRLQSNTLIPKWKFDVVFSQQAIGAEALGRPIFVDCACIPMGVIKCDKGKWDWLPKTQLEYEALEQRVIQESLDPFIDDVILAVDEKDASIPSLSKKRRIWVKLKTQVKAQEMPDVEHSMPFYKIVLEHYLTWFAVKSSFIGFGVYSRAFIALMSTFGMITVNSGIMAGVAWVVLLIFGVSAPFMMMFQALNAVYCFAYGLTNLYARVKGVVLPNREDVEDFKKYHNFMVFGFAILFILAVTQFIRAYKQGKKEKKKDLNTVENQGSTTLGIGLMLKGFGSLVLMAVKQLKPPGLLIDKEFISEFRRGSDAILEIVKGFLMLSKEKQEKFADKFKFSFFDEITDIENQAGHDCCNLLVAQVEVLKESIIFLTESGPLGISHIDSFREQEYDQFLSLQNTRVAELGIAYNAAYVAHTEHRSCLKCRTLLDKINFMNKLIGYLKPGAYRSKTTGETLDLLKDKKQFYDYLIAEYEDERFMIIPDSWILELTGFYRENRRRSAKDDDVLHRTWTLLRTTNQYKLFLTEHSRQRSLILDWEYKRHVIDSGIDPFYLENYVEPVDVAAYAARYNDEMVVETEVKRVSPYFGMYEHGVQTTQSDIESEKSDTVSETDFEDLPRDFIDPDPEPSLKHDFDRIHRSFLIKKFFKDYYWVIAIFLGFLVLGAYIIFKKRQKARKRRELESEAFCHMCATGDLNLENEGKHRQKRGGKEDAYARGEDYVAPVKTAKKAEKAMKHEEQLRKKTQYEEMVSNKEDFARQLGHTLVTNGLGREMHINDRRIPMTAGGIEPEKMLNYDTVLIRISSYEGEFHPQKDRHAMLEHIRKLASVGNMFKRPVLISRDGMIWYKLKNQTAGDMNQAEMSPDVWRQRARALKIELNDEQIKDIANSARPEREFSRLCLKALRAKTTEGLFYQGLQNEALVGGKIIDEEEMRKSLVTTYNDTYYTKGAAFYAANELISVAHNIYDLKLKKTDTPGEIYALEHPGAKESTPKVPLKVKDTCPEGDWAILESSVKGPSLPVYREDYEGSAFIVSIDSNNHTCLAVGPVFKKGNQLWHYIPTLQGHSGLPILHPSGKVLGIHKAYTGVANVGVSINEVLDRSRKKHFLTELSFKNQGRKEMFNFSYLPRHMVPEIRQFDPEVYKDYDLSWVGEGEILGVTDYKFKERSGFSVSDYYLSTHEEFGLPSPFESHYDVAIPSLESIHKDFSKYTRHIDFEPIKPVFDHSRKVMKDFIRACLVSKKLKLLDIVEALHTLNGKASTGWPVKNFIPQKETFFIKFFDTMDEYMRQIINGEDPDVAFDQLGKNELRLLEKLLENKVRSFNAASVYSYFLERIALGDYVDFMNDLPFFVTHSTSGWSPYYGNWNELVTYLHKPREGVPVKVYDDIDFGKWDSSLMPILFQMIFEVLEEMYDGEDLWIAHILFAYILKHIFAEAICIVPISPTEALVVMIFRGNKSGILCTFRFNCDLNTFGHFYSVNEIQYTLGMKMWDYAEFERFMAWVSCGDDFSFSVMVTHIWFSMEAYIIARKRICMFPESYREAPKGFLTFAGCETIMVNGVSCPKTNVDRMIFNVAIVKSDMPLSDYIQKLDNLIRISVFSDTEFVLKLIKFRDSLIRRFYSVDGVASVAQGVATLHEAMAMHFYVYEGLDLESEDEALLHDIQLCEDLKYSMWYWKVGELTDYKQLIAEEEAISYIVDGLNQCGVAVIDHLHKNNANIAKTEYKYHGNYCGPGWSAGKYQTSIESDIPSIDKLDEACREHDKSYANNEELDKADYKLAKEAWSEDKFLSTVIYLQGKLREIGLMTKGNKGSKKVSKEIKKVEKKIDNAMSKARYIPPRFNKRPGGSARRKSGGGRKRGGGKNVPVLRSYKSRSRPTKLTRVTKDSTVAVGTDYVETIAAPSSGNGTGTLLATVPISPEAWEGTRLAQTSNMFEKWDIQRYRFDYVPTAGTTTPGTLIMFIDPDPSDELLVSGEDLLKKARSARFAVEFQVSERASLSYRPERRGGDRYTSFDDSERFSSFGNLFVISMTALSNSLVCGTVHVDYAIKFYHPILETFVPGMSALYSLNTASVSGGASVTPFTKLNSSDSALPLYNIAALPNNVVEFNAGFNITDHLYVQLTFKEAGVFRLIAHFVVRSVLGGTTTFDLSGWEPLVHDTHWIFSNTSSSSDEMSYSNVVTDDTVSDARWYSGYCMTDLHISTPGTIVTMPAVVIYEDIESWDVINYSVTKLARNGPSDLAALSMKNLNKKLDKLKLQEEKLLEDRAFIATLKNAVARVKGSSTPNGGKQLSVVDLFASLKV